MTRPAAVLIGGPPATGKSTLALALAPRLDAALLDLDVATLSLLRDDDKGRLLVMWNSPS